jgi:hypothetical protein
MFPRFRRRVPVPWLDVAGVALVCLLVAAGTVPPRPPG